MNRPILQAGLFAGALALGLPGCHQAEKAAPSKKVASDSGDPTSWTDKDVTRGSSDSGAGDSGLPKSSGLKGTWSDEGRDIEKSLGIR